MMGTISRAHSLLMRRCRSVYDFDGTIFRGADTA